MASAMLLTMPGIPCLFTGDEVGAEFEPYRDSGTISWSDTHHLRSHFRTLIHLRRELPAFASGIWRVIEADAPDPVLACALGEGDSTVCVLLNFSDAPATVSIDAQTFEAMFPETTTLHDHHDGTTIDIPPASARQIALPGWGIRLLTAGGPV
jgi:glycosidase